MLKACYWAGASAVSLEETHHRQSSDLDFHTGKALFDVRPLLTELQLAFPDRFELLTTPDGFGSGFKGILVLSEKEKVTIEVLSNYQDVSTSELVESSLVPGMKRIGLMRFLADKIQYIVERSEAIDLVDFLVILRYDPRLTAPAREFIAGQDALILRTRPSQGSVLPGFTAQIHPGSPEVGSLARPARVPPILAARLPG